MTHAESRVLLSAITLFLTIPVYMVLFYVFEDTLWQADSEALLAANLTVGPTFALCWVLLWRRGINWTRGRRARTWVAGFGAAAPALIAYALATAATNEREIGQIAAGTCWLAVWVVSTAFIWRETPEERAKRLAEQGRTTLSCPRCGYNMTGLHQARCPECGTQFTLDELFASLTSQDRRLTEDVGSYSRNHPSPSPLSP